MSEPELDFTKLLERMSKLEQFNTKFETKMREEIQALQTELAQTREELAQTTERANSAITGGKLFIVGKTSEHIDLPDKRVAFDFPKQVDAVLLIPDAINTGVMPEYSIEHQSTSLRYFVTFRGEAAEWMKSSHMLGIKW